MFLLEILAALTDRVLLLFSHVTDRASFPKPLSGPEESALIERIARGDEEAKGLLVEHNLRLVAHIAKKYLRAGLDMDDLVSIGSIGLMKAVDTFRPENGRLAAYASRCIENEMLMAIRSGKKLKANVSLYESIGADRDGNEILLMDILSTDDDPVSDAVTRGVDASRAVRLMDDALESRERAILMMRFGLSDGVPHPQHEVARALGISRSYVSRIEARALVKLRRALEDGAPRP